jgi:hypothetical protein
VRQMFMTSLMMDVGVDVAGIQLAAAVVDEAWRIHRADKVAVAKASFRDTVD